MDHDIIHGEPKLVVTLTVTEAAEIRAVLGAMTVRLEKDLIQQSKDCGLEVYSKVDIDSARRTLNRFFGALAEVTDE